MDYFFERDGILGKSLKEYEERPSQIEYAKSVGSALEQKKNLIIEAGTGTGKTLAYLLPIVVNARSKGVHAVVATANIALQEQLIKKDLPLLKNILASSMYFDFGLAKGKNNYLCRHQLETQRKRQDLFSKDPIAKEIEAWADKTVEGDRSELTIEPPEEIWKLYSVTASECIRCDYSKKDLCFAKNAKAALADKDIVVCNYHLLCAHVSVAEETGRDVVLPSFGVLACDEAHKFADIARSSFGWDIGEFVIQRLCRYLLSMVKDGEKAKLGERADNRLKSSHNNIEKARSESRDFFDEVNKFHAGKLGGKRIPHKDILKVKALQNSLVNLAEDYNYISSMAEKIYPKDGADDSKARCKKESKRCLEVVGQLAEINQLSDKNAVYYSEHIGRSKVVKIVKRKLDVSDYLWLNLFQPLDSVILTSATLDSGDDFAFISKELGLKSADKMKVVSPFNYNKQCLLVLPKEASNPQDRDYSQKICPVIEKVMHDSQGRALCLFTSYKNMNIVRNYLLPKNNGFKILCQGDAPRNRLIEEFRSDVHSVLLGTESFWGGVDIPGEALSCVVIDRLPFKSPGDPVWDELCRRSDDWFWSLSLPSAVIQFKQGVGRLIRRKNDRGVVLILDERLVTKNYGNMFIDALPNVMKSRDIKHVKEFLDGKLGGNNGKN